MIGRHLGHLEQGGDEAVGLAPVLHALAHRVDARIEGLQGVVDHHPALAVETGGLGQVDVGADAHRHHHQIRGHLQTVLEAHALDPLVAEDGLGHRRHDELHAPFLQGTLQQLAGVGVQLTLHEPVGDVHHGHVHALNHEAVGRLQAQQAAADDDGPLVLARRLDHAFHVVDVAEGHHPVQVVARQGQDDGMGAGSQEQAVVFGLGAVVGDHLAVAAVDLHHRPAGVEGDAVLLVPGAIVEDDVIDGLLAGEYRREEDAVVVGVGLRPEDGDVVEVGRQLQQLFQGTHPGHAVADEDEFLFHGGLRSLPFRTRRPYAFLMPNQFFIYLQEVTITRASRETAAPPPIGAVTTRSHHLGAPLPAPRPTRHAPRTCVHAKKIRF